MRRSIAEVAARTPAWYRRSALDEQAMRKARGGRVVEVRDPYPSLIQGGLKLYKGAVSPWLPKSCRFLPTCSDYAASVLVSHGPVRGGWLAMKRVCRCRPFGPSGYDPPPERRAAMKCEA